MDVFAGSGALGAEALSRGASACLFIESDPAALAAIGANVEALGLADRTRPLRRDAARLAPRTERDGAAFDVAFLDPPYGAGLAGAALERLCEGDWLAHGALAVVERGADEPAMAPAGYALLGERAWGAARVSFLRRL